MRNWLGALCIVGLGFLAAAPAQAGSDGWSVKDARIEGSLVTAYTLNEHLNPFAIDVTSRNGKVTLQGTVDSDIDKSLAGEIAQGVDGVKDVDNELDVDKHAAASNDKDRDGDFADVVKDATVTASIKTQLLANTNTDGLDIHVETDNGTVVLTGQVESEEQSDLAEQLAENVSGVKDVDNKLSVR